MVERCSKFFRHIDQRQNFKSFKSSLIQNLVTLIIITMAYYQIKMVGQCWSGSVRLLDFFCGYEILNGSNDCHVFLHYDFYYMKEIVCALNSVVDCCNCVNGYVNNFFLVAFLAVFVNHLDCNPCIHKYCIHLQVVRIYALLWELDKGMIFQFSKRLSCIPCNNHFKELPFLYNLLIKYIKVNFILAIILANNYATIIISISILFSLFAVLA